MKKLKRKRVALSLKKEIIAFNKKMKILILCTGNSARSQMAQGRLEHFYPDWEVYSAGTKPAEQVHPLAIEAMAQDGIDISSHRPKSVQKYLDQSFDIVLTVCDDAQKDCPVFAGEVKYRIHHSFEDPAKAKGSQQEQLEVFQKVRDQIKEFVKKISV